MSDDLSEMTDAEFDWFGFDMIASVATDRNLDINARIDAALATGRYRPQPEAQHLNP
jgi:hypothetical protein